MRIIFQEELLLNFSETLVTLAVEESYKGGYIQDLIEVGNFKVLAALRYENQGTVNTSISGGTSDVIDDYILLPRFGLTYSVNDNVNVYASYTEGFEQQGISNLINELNPGTA